LAKYKKRFRSLRQHRYEVLREELFTKAEARQLSHFKFKQPYIRQIRVDRRELAREVRKLGLPHRKALAELRWRVRKVYEINGWADAYAMIRWYRERAIDRGEYTPPVKKRPRLNKGDVAAQKKRWRARQERKEESRVGVQYDSRGEAIGFVEYDQESGKFIVRKA